MNKPNFNINNPMRSSMNDTNTLQSQIILLAQTMDDLPYDTTLNPLQAEINELNHGTPKGFNYCITEQDENRYFVSTSPETTYNSYIPNFREVLDSDSCFNQMSTSKKNNEGNYDGSNDYQNIVETQLLHSNKLGNYNQEEIGISTGLNNVLNFYNSTEDYTRSQANNYYAIIDGIVSSNLTSLDNRKVITYLLENTKHWSIHESPSCYMVKNKQTKPLRNGNINVIDTIIPPVKYLERYNELKKPWIQLMLSKMELQQLNYVSELSKIENAALTEKYNRCQHAYNSILPQLQSLQIQNTLLFEIVNKLNAEEGQDCGLLKEFIEIKTFCIDAILKLRQQLGKNHISILESVYDCSDAVEIKFVHQVAEISIIRPWADILFDLYIDEKKSSQETVTQRLLKLHSSQNKK